MNIQTSILIITCSLLTLGCASKSKREFIGGVLILLIVGGLLLKSK